MMKAANNYILFPAHSRGYADHGWLKSYHSFSFANYFNPERIHFGALRVLNDDWVAPGQGFGKHPHDNMEIISIPLSGSLAHQDSMGNTKEIQFGEVQVMSAGTGIQHSEFNYSPSNPVSFLQIWIFPNKREVTPRYDQKMFAEENRQNRFQLIVSPDGAEDSLWIHQNAWLSLSDFKAGYKDVYNVKNQGSGIYVFVLSGGLKVGDHLLEKRDAIGLWELSSIDIEALNEDSSFLIIEVPMQL